jgi:hypothetical protein
MSIWTTTGRLHIRYRAGARQGRLLESQQGESDLVFYKGNFYLLATCNVNDPDPIGVEGLPLAVSCLGDGMGCQTRSRH